MAKIVAQYEAEGEHYIEFEVNGVTLQINVSNDRVHVIGHAAFEDVCTRACNSFYAMLKGGRFKKVVDWHIFRETGRIPNPITPAERHAAHRALDAIDEQRM
jgi:hypothetical protein